MKYYQLTYLISPNFSEEEIKTFQEKINSLIVEKQGILDKIKNPQKKKLGSLIREFSQAYLIESNFYLESQKLEDLKKQIEEKSEILRFLISRKKIVKKPLKIKKRVLTPTASQKTTTKVELKEIDKKLDEILNQ